MNYTLDNETIQLLWKSLKQTCKTSNTKLASKLANQIIQKGWAFRADVEYLLYCFDSRLGDYEFDVEKISKQLEVRWEIAYFKPNGKARDAAGIEGLQTEELALFLIILEFIGFQVNPSLLVDYLLPRLQAKTKELLSETELDIFWYNTTRQKNEAIFLQLQNISDKIRIIETFKTPGNYKIVVKGIDNNAELIEITAPNHRKQRSTELCKCEECGYQWHKGDPESSSIHRSEHRRRMKYLDPVPIKEMIEEKKKSNDYELVTTSSPKWKHREMYLRALAFKREFHYDFVQWHSNKGDHDPFVQGFLFTDTTGAIIGACAFRTNKKNSLTDGWKLDWIWITPKERQKGHLSLRWEFFRKRFGDFGLTFPVSDEMKAFLHKKGDSKLLEL